MKNCSWQLKILLVTNATDRFDAHEDSVQQEEIVRHTKTSLIKIFDYQLKLRGKQDCIKGIQLEQHRIFDLI